MDRVVLEYKRVNVDKSTGKVTYVDEVGTQSDLEQFESIEFKPMLESFAAALKKYPTAVGVWKRTDRAGLIPYDLDPKVTDLFRSDTEAAIASMCPPSRTPSATVRRVQEERKPLIPSIRAGFDVLADAFGDFVYARTRSRGETGISYVECPFCGFWTPVCVGNPYHADIGPGDYGHSFCDNPHCRGNKKTIVFLMANDRWVAYKVTTLLAIDAKRFYFPRAWNDGRPWVSREDLSKKYDEYVKEKST